jgi:nucleotide-binding universal stress UspA family protein
MSSFHINTVKAVTLTDTLSITVRQAENINSMRLLVAIDFSEFADNIITEAERMARTLTAKVFLLHVLPAPSPIIDQTGNVETMQQADSSLAKENFSELSESASAKLLSISERLQKNSIDTTVIIGYNNEVDAIIDASEKNRVDMIMLGTHGHGALYHLLIGSVSEGVVRKATCPVIIVPARKR